MNALESVGRLVRLFDANWNPKGHLFTDIPDYDFDTEEITLVLPVSAVDVVRSSDCRNVALPHRPRTWAVRGWRMDEHGVHLFLMDYSRFIETLLLPPEQCLAGNESSRVDGTM